MKQPQNKLVAGIAALVILGTITGVWMQRPMPLPDFEHPVVEVKKQAFFDYLSPAIEHINEEIRAERTWLLELAQPEEINNLSLLQAEQLQTLASDYDLDPQAVDSNQSLVEELLLRIDVIPKSLALVQAAKESGWGSSRFARHGYNLFGQQCFDKGCGFTPAERKAGRSHEVAEFDSVESAVRAYMHNLNTHYRYQGFRELRAQLRQQDEALTGTRLAHGLNAYSERGKVYIEEIIALIRHNGLE
ncbi:MAG: glucosaminidase domain-containing protein [Pseudomonadaceae bacterium]|jgi:Bax protein|nr:glucosaminidase domain-containing protein [Pseudomonadaceae bacterium]